MPSKTAKAPAKPKTTTAVKRTTAAKRTTRARRPTEKQIAKRAYFIAQESGGDPVENWLQAERELRAA